MVVESIAVGHLEVVALLDGEGDLGGTMAESFPAVPPEALAAARERDPGIYGDHDSWHLWIRAWLIRHPGGAMLVDTGTGGPRAPAAAWWTAPDRLLEALRETGTAPDAIDTVALTHVHDDHIGGTVAFPDDGGDPVPAFPRATYLVQLADRRWQAALAAESEEDRAIDELLLRPLERAGRLEVIEGDHDVADGVQLHPVPGHTPGHQIVRLRSHGARALILADTFNHPIQFGRPDLPSGSDDAPALAASSRRAVLAEARSHPGTTLATAHLAQAFGEVVSDARGLVAWSPLGPRSEH